MMADAGGNAAAGRDAAWDADESWAQRRLAGRQPNSDGPEAPAEGEDDPSEDKRAAERRREARRTGPAAGARVLLRGRNDEVKLLNLSGRGAMIATPLTAEPDERIAIQFGDCNPIHGTVRWARDGRMGIEFARQTALLVPAQWRFVGGRRSGEAPTDSQRPRPPRQPVLWECELYWGRGAEPARLRNISAEGAMIDAAKNVPIGTEVVLALRSAGTVSGTVRWCRSGQVGLKFERAFDMRKLVDPASIAAVGASNRPGVLKPLYLETELDPSSPWAAKKDGLRPQDFR